MTEIERYEERKTAIHLLRSGAPISETAQRLNRSVSWVYKWRDRFKAVGWAGLHSQSRTPKHSPNRLPESVRRSIREARSELEAEAAEGSRLCYIGSGAVRARLEEKGIARLPSTASIERVLQAAGMTRSPSQEEDKTTYPRLHPSTPGQLCQVDIVPHYLKGGQAIACFNAIDVVSRYPTGQAYERRRSREAAEFLTHVWQTIGIPKYTQVDNEGCFSGGFTHPGVLGKVLRLALYVGTELVFSPVRHPESNGFVERFHQDYDLHVWHGTNLTGCADVQAHAEGFFTAYHHSRHHSALRGHSPAEVHYQSSVRKLSPTFTLPEKKLPLTEGQAHFMRLVSPEKTVSVLNLTWPVSDVEPYQGVWVTLTFRLDGATLRVYDQSPDVLERRCLAEHPFPLKEDVQPCQVESQGQPTGTDLWIDMMARALFRVDRVRTFLSTMF